MAHNVHVDGDCVVNQHVEEFFGEDDVAVVEEAVGIFTVPAEFPGFSYECHVSGGDVITVVGVVALYRKGGAEKSEKLVSGAVGGAVFSVAGVDSYVSHEGCEVGAKGDSETFWVSFVVVEVVHLGGFDQPTHDETWVNPVGQSVDGGHGDGEVAVFDGVDVVGGFSVGEGALD